MEQGNLPYPPEFEFKRIDAYVADLQQDIEWFLDDAAPELIEGLDYDSLQALELVLRLISLQSSHLLEDSDFVRACYNGYRLGWMIADMATPHTPKMSLQGIIDSTESAEIVIEQVSDASQGVLSSSPYVDGLIGRYQELVDPSGKYGMQVETFAGLAIAMIESAERSICIDAEVEAFAESITTWETREGS